MIFIISDKQTYDGRTVTWSYPKKDVDGIAHSRRRQFLICGYLWPYAVMN